jgi:hypothetical protein
MIDPRLRLDLAKRQLPKGGWGSASSTQCALEPTCLAVLALHTEASAAYRSGFEFLLITQNSNGSWPAFDGDDDSGSWATALAVIALAQGRNKSSATSRAIRWLTEARGRESHWLWRWKFRLFDTQVRFDPDKYGWPWLEGETSWVIPTAFSLIALQQTFPSNPPDEVAIRIDRGIQMLLDRACPEGGWNAGNGVVYGVPLAGHPDATAIALLALRRSRHHRSVVTGLDWLRHSALRCHSAYSLAWALLALAAMVKDDKPSLADWKARLLQMIEAPGIRDSGTIALTILALEAVEGNNPFEVSP